MARQFYGYLLTHFDDDHDQCPIWLVDRLGRRPQVIPRILLVRIHPGDGRVYSVITCIGIIVLLTLMLCGIPMEIALGEIWLMMSGNYSPTAFRAKTPRGHDDLF